MTQFLRFGGLLLCWLLAAVLPAAATHLVGGEMSYRYLGTQGGTYHYEVSATVYFNKETGSAAPDGRPSLPFQFYDKARSGLLVQQLSVPRIQYAEITPAQPAGCALPVPRVTAAKYRADVYLAASTAGYLVVYSEGARNIDISNLLAAGSTAMGLSMHLPPTPIANQAAVFSDLAVAVICQNDTTFILNNAYDADGDRLEYSFGTPYSTMGVGVLNTITYAPGFSQLAPFGVTGFVDLNPATGLASYYSTQLGRFVVAVDVREYRRINGQEMLLNTTRRDVQLVVRACPNAPTRAPAFTPATLTTRSYTIEEGQSVDFGIEAQLPGQQLTLRVASVLLDGNGPFDATFDNSAGTGAPVGTVTLTGPGSVAGRFRFHADCGTARPTPYDVIVTAQNNACGGRNVGEIFRVQVTRAAGPSGISGRPDLCAYSTETYAAQGLAPARGFLWTVRGGRILGPTTGASVQVEWGAGPAGRLTARGLTALGCPTDSAALAVTLRPGPTISGPTVYCPKTSRGLRYSVAAVPGSTYRWSIDNGRIVAGQGTGAVEVDIPDGSTATLRVIDETRQSCTGLLVVTPDRACLAFYNVMTPNGDGLNDAFVVEHLDYYPGSALRIYSRWGRELYRTADYHNDWRGETQPAGVYYYLLQLPDGRVFKGWFELLR